VHVELYIPQLFVILFVDRRLDWYRLTHIRLHAASYTYCFQLYILFSNVRPVPYFCWLQLQCRGGLTGVFHSAVSHWVAHWSKRLLFGLTRLQSRLVEVFLEQWLAVVERGRRWSRKEVGSPEDYIVSFKSKWNVWQPTWTFNSNWILLHIPALQIAAGDSNGPAICSMSAHCWLFLYRDTSWWTRADISCLSDITRTLFNRKDVCWCLSQDIARILPESHANHQLIMYG